MDNISFFKINYNSLDKEIFKKFKFESGKLISEYYQEYYAGKFIDLTFGILFNNEVVGYVSCCVLDGRLCFPNNGVSIELFLEDSIEITKIYNLIIEHITLLARQYSCNEIIIQDNLINDGLSDLGNVLFNKKYHSNITYEMLIDYKNFDEISYRQKLRKSYKSLINWGKKNLEIILINTNNLSLEKFLTFKDFHLKIAGKKTRSDDSWNIQYKMIEQGFGELALAYLKKELIAGSLLIDQNDVSIYFTGVYERELFEFGVSHYLLYQGICRSYERKNTSKFSLGYFDTNIKDPKWYNIQFFKKGFCERLVPTILWSKEISN
jgi:hypothetical protein